MNDPSAPSRAPKVKTPSVPGPNSRTWMLKSAAASAPMGPRRAPGSPPSTVVFARAAGSRVWDVDGNEYVDLAAGFGSLLLGHSHPAVVRALQVQGDRLLQAMGDLYASDARIALLHRLSGLLRRPDAEYQGILGLSGADAVDAALKTAVLATGKLAVVAFDGSYHGLSHGPLSLCGLRSSYREPFSAQLNPAVTFLPFPDELRALGAVELRLREGDVGAIVVEPILGRGGVRPMAPATLLALAELAKRHDALLIVDEIWTGLGRSGHLLYSHHAGVSPDIVCLGKGLGGGVPVSACFGKRDLMAHWSREKEVVHTSTFAGAPLGCATALALLDGLETGNWVARARSLGERFKARLAEAPGVCDFEVRGEGLMLAVDFGARPGAAFAVMIALLQRGYIVSTGGGAREVMILTPPLNIEPSELDGFLSVLPEAIGEALGT